MWWTQYIVVLMGILSIVQDARSESQALEQNFKTYVERTINNIVSECDEVKNNEHLKQEWSDLVDRETVKLIQSIEKLNLIEQKPLAEFSDEESLVEYFENYGLETVLEKDLTETYDVLKAFCDQHTVHDIATRVLSHVFESAKDIIIPGLFVQELNITPKDLESSN